MYRTSTLVWMSAIALTAGTLVTAQAAPGQRPCADIRAACQQAGFVQGGAREGAGLRVDCIGPIMQARPQRPKASKPLPQVDPQLVDACKARNPNFGQRNAARGPGGAPMPSADQAAPDEAESSGPPAAAPIQGHRPNTI
jgi:hypothetical protein